MMKKVHRRLSPADPEDVRQRYELAVMLRRSGATFAEIGQRLGYADSTGAYRLLTRGQCARQAAQTMQPQGAA